ncbi:DUF421 domain-containing protein [Radiobacillus deserti]|uniref:DUF421 domain-containing protein n=1 Tax=Radiobacillus deserti TaxID=2594883 RepID=A0A516KDT6_9BACI|nr:DUF421 domain-containing protein [Radiobacillus deserti]QDP39558.1 DUF421 domain-containing protein [Radiobacillus deserti]
MPEFLLILVRSIISFIVILLMARIMGKKQISHLTFFDYVIGITIGSLASEISVNQNLTMIDGLLALIVFGGFSLLLSFISMKSIRFRMLVEGRPTVLIQNGKILEENLFKVKMTLDDLILFLREENAFTFSDVELAVLETNGRMSVMKKTDRQPVTRKDLGLDIPPEHTPKVVIMDGNVLKKSLTQMGFSEEQLLEEVKKQGAHRFEDVFAAQIDSKGTVFVDLYQEQATRPEIKQEQLLTDKLKKAQKELETLASKTKDSKAKAAYEKEMGTLSEMIRNIDTFLKMK